MQLRPELALGAAIRSLTDVVSPAIDTDNQPAREQLQVVIGLLSLVLKRLPLEFDYDCDELTRLSEFAAALATAHDGIDEVLGGKVAHAKAVLAGARSAPGELQNSIRELRQAMGAIIASSYSRLAPEARERMSELVLAYSDAQLTRERAWLAPQGWEANPEGLPSLEELLAGR